MKSYLKGKFSKIIAVIIISAIAGGAAKDFYSQQNIRITHLKTLLEEIVMKILIKLPQ